MQEQGILDREDFFLDPSLVLYLPLHQLDGSSFMSRDAYGHLCTVTGALWGLDGRYFDGIDNLITIPHNATVDMTNNDFTILAWIKVEDNAVGKVIISKYGTPGWNLQVRDTEYLNWYSYEADTNTRGVTGTTSLVGMSHFVCLWNDFDGYTRLYVDLEEQGTADNTPYDTLTSPTHPIRIGDRSASDRPYLGYIKEIAVYKRLLSPGERSSYYYGTKWRYQ